MIIDHPEVQAHHQAVMKALQARLSSGWMSFHDFMQFALYEPGLGYYESGLTTFGEGGDFVTAPEMGPWFAQCVARQVAEIASELAQPWSLLELGPGRGQLACDVLQTLEAMGELPDQYLCLDVSGVLAGRAQQTQRSQLSPALWERITWCQQLPEQPFRGVIIANEVLDAMPVERIVYEDGRFEQMGVVWEADQLVWSSRPVDQQAWQGRLAAALSHWPTVPTGRYVSEWHPHMQPWVQSLHDCLDQGAALLFDYGYPRHEYYHPARSEGTLMCYLQHHAHSDPLVHVGCQDITAHVDFTALAEASVAAGWQVAGYTDQAHCLMSLGLGEGLDTLSDEARWQAAAHIKRLSLPTEMGELVKVMALTKGYDRPLSGFQWVDRRGKL